MTDDLIFNILATEACFWRSLGTVFAVRDGVTAWSAGIPDQYLNGILATDLPGTWVQPAIREAVRQFQLRGLPWTWGSGPETILMVPSSSSPPRPHSGRPSLSTTMSPIWTGGRWPAPPCR